MPEATLLAVSLKLVCTTPRSSWRLRILATRRGARDPTSDRTLHRDTSCAPYARASLLIQL